MHFIPAISCYCTISISYFWDGWNHHRCFGPKKSPGAAPWRSCYVRTACPPKIWESPCRASPSCARGGLRFGQVIGDYFWVWLLNIAMGNGLFIDGLPIKNGDVPSTLVYVSHYQMIPLGFAEAVNVVVISKFSGESIGNFWWILLGHLEEISAGASFPDDLVSWLRLFRDILRKYVVPQPLCTASCSLLMSLVASWPYVQPCVNCFHMFFCRKKWAPQRERQLSVCGCAFLLAGHVPNEKWGGS